MGTSLLLEVVSHHADAFTPPLSAAPKTCIFRFGHVFQFDTGSSAGEIVGHSKALNAVAIRRQRPFRASTAGDDGLIIYHTGRCHRDSRTLMTEA